MKLPRVSITVRLLMVVVAAVAIGLGVQDRLARWRALARLYEITAGRTERSIAEFKFYAAMSHEQWLADCRAVDERNLRGTPTWGPERHGPEPAFARCMIDHLDLRAKKYHRAAAQP